MVLWELSTLVLSGQIQLKATVNSTEQDVRLQKRLLAFAGYTGQMLRNQQFVGSSLTNHLDSYQDCRHYDRVKSVHADRFHGMQALDWPSVWLGKGDVSTEVPNRSAVNIK